MRSESEDLRKRLGAAEAELERKDAENGRLAAELGAARSSTESAPVIARVERGVYETAADLADGLKAAREEAILQQQERVFTVDFEKRTFTASPVALSMPLHPTLEMRLLTVESELVGESEGGIRFFPDGSSTGGRIELELLGERAVVNVQWSTGAVTLER